MTMTPPIAPQVHAFSPQLDVVDDGIDSPGPATYLTPEALMVYCQTRLQGIDSQVDAAMTQQQNVNWEQQSIASLLNEMNTDSANTNGGVMRNGTECQQLEQNLEELISQIQAKDPGCSQLGQLEQLHDAVMATGTGPYTDGSQPPVYHGFYNGSSSPSGSPPNGKTAPPNVNNDQDGGIGANEFSNFSGTLTQINSSLNSGAELQMINIQSLMSDRSNAIQLTTSILQSYDDGVGKIADNIGK
jgi:hypothetical protein